MSIFTGLLGGTTSVVGPTLTTNSTLNDDGTVNRDKRNDLLVTAVSTTASLAVGGSLNAKNHKEVQEKYSSAYMDSVSDEELISALEEFGLLEATDTQDSVNKTI